MANANPGLQLYLAIQMLKAVETSYRRYKSPLSSELIDLVDELDALRDKGKKLAEARAKSTSGDLDNATLPGGAMTQPSTSADAGKVS